MHYQDPIIIHKDSNFVLMGIIINILGGRRIIWCILKRNSCELFGETKVWPGLNTAVKRSAAHIILHQPCQKLMICHCCMQSYAIAAAS